MAPPKKAPVEHKDRFGQVISVGNKVVLAKSNSLRVCSIDRITTKMVHAVPVNGGYPGSGFLVYPNDVVLVEGPDVLHYMLLGKKG